ncbi:5793_t:CDS:2 [Paraglomus brasilianum]|uniref:Serine/threonine-protein phosphatase 2A activator n=1 Tax=Paraglomus brasilianum TaxID=144538 RepID=A0A9N8W954_9GLOM|nr:5793_t:CDS:2 [Paraglomus brasilianum]
MASIFSSPLPLTDHNFVEPRKMIRQHSDIDVWVESKAFARFLMFIKLLNESILNKKISDPCTVSETTQKLVDILEQLSNWIDEIPPLPTPQRFGNKAFRDWIARLENNAVEIHKNLLLPQWHDAIVELVPLFNGSFGHGIRIDYGSGHELNFVTWLCCLTLLGVFTQEDYHALILRIFSKYLDLVRKLQIVYNLEPAGSHGVWGLDDHQFLSYYWGSAQLRDHQRLKPKSIINKEFVEMFADDYMYFGCIKHINKIKRGPFHEHSPILYDISGVQSWQKVNSGLLKMYVADVLKKFPIVQHLLFGTLLPFEPNQD